MTPGRTSTACRGHKDSARGPAPRHLRISYRRRTSCECRIGTGAGPWVVPAGRPPLCRYSAVREQPRGQRDHHRAGVQPPPRGPGGHHHGRRAPSGAGPAAGALRRGGRDRRRARPPSTRAASTSRSSTARPSPPAGMGVSRQLKNEIDRLPADHRGGAAQGRPLARHLVAGRRGARAPARPADRRRDRRRRAAPHPRRAARARLRRPGWDDAQAQTWPALLAPAARGHRPRRRRTPRG